MTEERYGDDEITCPYCEHAVSNSWEYGDGGEQKCSMCGKKFTWSKEERITYGSNPSCELNNEDHDWPEYRAAQKSPISGEWFRCRECTKCGSFEYYDCDESGNKLEES